MIVEDTPSLRDSLKIILQRSGYDVTAVADAEQAEISCKADYPDLILLDILLPRMNGLDLLAKLRKTACGKDVAVIVITQLSDHAYREMAKKLGVKKYFVKANFSLFEILSAVDEILTAIPEKKSARVDEGQKVRSKVIKSSKSGSGNTGKNKSKAKKI